jgi:hypothetical protein
LELVRCEATVAAIINLVLGFKSGTSNLFAMIGSNIAVEEMESRNPKVGFQFFLQVKSQALKVWIGVKQPPGTDHKTLTLDR